MGLKIGCCPILLHPDTFSTDIIVGVHSVQGVLFKETCKCWSFRKHGWINKFDFKKKRMQNISIVYCLTSIFLSVSVSVSGQLFGQLLQWVALLLGWNIVGFFLAPLTLRGNGQARSCSCEVRFLWFCWLASTLPVCPHPSVCWALGRTASSWHTFSQQLVFHRGLW